MFALVVINMQSSSKNKKRFWTINSMLCKENQSDCLTWHYRIHKKNFKKRDEKKDKRVKKVATLTFSKQKCETLGVNWHQC
jgi:hypothetical protein